MSLGLEILVLVKLKFLKQNFPIVKSSTTGFIINYNLFCVVNLNVSHVYQALVIVFLA